MSRKSKKVSHYEIEGNFPVGHVMALQRQHPSQWHRDWRCWHQEVHLRDARNTLRAGSYLKHRTCPISYSELRLVAVSHDGTRTVIK
jgi:hypothetical protein